MNPNQNETIPPVAFPEKLDQIRPTTISEWFHVVRGAKARHYIIGDRTHRFLFHCATYWKSSPLGLLSGAADYAAFIAPDGLGADRDARAANALFLGAFAIGDFPEAYGALVELHSLALDELERKTQNEEWKAARGKLRAWVDSVLKNAIV